MRESWQSRRVLQEAAERVTHIYWWILRLEGRVVSRQTLVAEGSVSSTQEELCAQGFLGSPLHDTPQENHAGDKSRW